MRLLQTNSSPQHRRNCQQNIDLGHEELSPCAERLNRIDGGGRSWLSQRCSLSADTYSMTRLIADQPCSVCNGMLVPPKIATHFVAPSATDYVCAKCGRLYQWVGNPPKLMLTIIAPPLDDI
jgi:hypothetical protein